MEPTSHTKVNVRLPDGTIVRNVPEGTTQEELLRRVEAYRQAKKPPVGPVKAIGYSAAEAVLPSAAFMAASAPFWKWSLALAKPTLGASIAVPILAGLTASVATGLGQRKVLEKAAPKFVEEADRAYKTRPFASLIGNVLGSYPAFGLGGIKTIAEAPKAIARVIGRRALTDKEKKALTQMAAQAATRAALGAGLGAVQQLAIPPHQLDPRGILESAAFMQFVGAKPGMEPWLGRKASKLFPEVPVPKWAEPPPGAKPPPAKAKKPAPPKAPVAPQTEELMRPDLEEALRKFNAGEPLSQTDKAVIRAQTGFDPDKPETFKIPGAKPPKPTKAKPPKQVKPAPAKTTEPTEPAKPAPVKAAVPKTVEEGMAEIRANIDAFKKSDGSLDMDKVAGVFAGNIAKAKVAARRLGYTAKGMPIARKAVKEEAPPPKAKESPLEEELKPGQLYAEPGVPGAKTFPTASEAEAFRKTLPNADKFVVEKLGKAWALAVKAEPKPKKPHEILGVAPDATEQEIKTAMRQAALKLHPDKRPGDPKAQEEFMRMYEAYEKLMRGINKEPEPISAFRVRIAGKNLLKWRELRFKWEIVGTRGNYRLRDKATGELLPEVFKTKKGAEAGRAKLIRDELIKFLGKEGKLPPTKTTTKEAPKKAPKAPQKALPSTEQELGQLEFAFSKAGTKKTAVKKAAPAEAPVEEGGLPAPGKPPAATSSLDDFEGTMILYESDIPTINEKFNKTFPSLADKETVSLSEIIEAVEKSGGIPENVLAIFKDFNKLFGDEKINLYSQIIEKTRNRVREKFGIFLPGSAEISVSKNISAPSHLAVTAMHEVIHKRTYNFLVSNDPRANVLVERLRVLMRYAHEQADKYRIPKWHPLFHKPTEFLAYITDPTVFNFYSKVRVKGDPKLGILPTTILNNLKEVVYKALRWAKVNIKRSLLNELVDIMGEVIQKEQPPLTATSRNLRPIASEKVMAGATTKREESKAAEPPAKVVYEPNVVEINEWFDKTFPSLAGKKSAFLSEILEAVEKAGGVPKNVLAIFKDFNKLFGDERINLYSYIAKKTDKGEREILGFLSAATLDIGVSKNIDTPSDIAIIAMHEVIHRRTYNFLISDDPRAVLLSERIRALMGYARDQADKYGINKLHPLFSHPTEFLAYMTDPEVFNFYSKIRVKGVPSLGILPTTVLNNLKEIVYRALRWARVSIKRSLLNELVDIMGEVIQKKQPPFPKTWSSLRLVLAEKVRARATAKREESKIAGLPLKVVNKVKEIFDPLYDMADKARFLRDRNRLIGRIGRVEDSAYKLVKMFEPFSEEERKNAALAIIGKYPIGKLPEGLQKPVRRTIRLFVAAGRALVKRGLMPKETFEKYKGKYAPNIYLRYLIEQGPLVGGKFKMYLNYLKRRNLALPKEIADELGLVKTPELPVFLGLVREWGDIFKYDYLQRVLLNPNVTYYPSVVKVGNVRMGIDAALERLKIYKEFLPMADEEQRPIIQAKIDELEKATNKAIAAAKRAPENFIRMPNNLGYGALRGTFIHKAVAEDIVVKFEIHDPGQARRFARRIANLSRTITSAWKGAKVAGSPPAMGRNAISNIFQLNLSGMPFSEIFPTMIRAVKEMSSNGHNYRRAIREGVFAGSWGEVEIADLVKAVEREIKIKPATDFLSSVLEFGAKLGRLYGKIDEFFKFVKYLEQISKGKSPADAAIEAQKWIMDYSFVSPEVRLLREHLFGIPFVTYQTKILPLLLEAARERPWVFAKYLAIPAVLTAYALREEFTEDEWESIQKGLSKEMANGSLVLVPFRDAHGRPQVVNLSYFFPWGTWMEAARNLYTGEPGRAYIQFSQNPILLAWSALLTGIDPGTGRIIYSFEDPPNVRLAAQFQYLFDLSVPSWLSSYGLGKRTLEAFGLKEVTPFETKLTPAQALLRWTGTTVTPVGDEEYIRQFRALEAQLRLVSIRFRAKLRKAEPEEIEKLQREYAATVQKLIRRRMEPIESPEEWLRKDVIQPIMGTKKPTPK